MNIEISFTYKAPEKIEEKVVEEEISEEPELASEEDQE